MMIIPVLDLKKGKVVHGIAGRRDEYKPVESVLVSGDSSDPYKLLSAFSQKLKLKSLYIADLDALEGTGDNFEMVRKLKVEFPGIEFMLDAGFSRIEGIEESINFGIDRIIIATESMTDENLIEDLKQFNRKKFIFSMDFREGVFLLNLSDGTSCSPTGFIEKLVKQGFRNFILLDVARVGTGQGVTEEFIELRARFPELFFITGGGVRDLEGAMKVKESKFDGLLLATTLHNGNLGREEIKKLRKGRV